MSIEAAGPGIDEEMLRQLLLEYPDRCQSCDRAASCIILLMVRTNYDDTQIRDAVKVDAQLAREKCVGQVELEDRGCFSDAMQCYLQTEQYLESKTTAY